MVELGQNVKDGERTMGALVYSSGRAGKRKAPECLCHIYPRHPEHRSCKKLTIRQTWLVTMCNQD